jgi:hypothetical protein
MRRISVSVRCLAAAVATLVVSASAAYPVQAAGGLTVYLSPSGSDANPGTSPAQPLRSLQKARDVVRTLNADMAGDITVSLADGTYQLTQPLALDGRDSGSGGHNVIWAAAPGARPVISGGRQVTGWQRPDTGKKVWTAAVPAGLETRQLYVNGVRAQRASGPLPVKVTKTATGYTTDSPAMDNWRNPEHIEFVYTAGLGGWTQPRCPVRAISPTKITMAQPCWDNTDRRPPRIPNQAWNLVGRPKLHVPPTSVENAIELLDRPGEWYLDQSANRLHYLPRPGEDLTTANVVAPVLEALVFGRGTASAPIHHLAFDGLQFSYATWLRPSTPEGFSEIQATYAYTGKDAAKTQGLCTNVPGGTCPYGAWTKTPGHVSFTYARNVRFTGGGFAHLGGTGLDLGRGTQNSTVQGVVFTDVSGNGLQLGEVDNPEAAAIERASSNKLLNNYVHAVAAEFHSGVGIFVGYAEKTTIAHNQLSDLSYTGISMGWGGWLDKIQKPGLSNYSTGNSISNNLIFDHMLHLNDGGGIYINGGQGRDLVGGLKIVGNVIHDENGQSNSKGIYTDNGANYVTISGNGLYHNPIDWTRRHRNWGGTTQYNPYDIQHNYWMKPPPETTGGGVTIENNHAITGPSQIPSSIIANAGLEAAYRHLLAWRPAG